MAISYVELDNSPRECLVENGVKITRRFMCAWADRWDLMAELRGNTYSPGGTIATCREACAEPFPGKNLGTGSTSAWEKAIVTATWETAGISGGGGGEPVGAELISESIEPMSQHLTLPYEKYVWASDNQTLKTEEAPFKLAGGGCYVLTRHQLETVPTACLSLVGKINSAVVTPLTAGLTGLSFAAQTLLMDNPPAITRVFRKTIAGVLSPGWTVTIRLQYNPNWDGATARGWNWFWRQDIEDFDRIKIKGGAIVLPYPVASFAGLYV